MKQLPYFEDISSSVIDSWKDGTIFLDIDHTLLAPMESSVSVKVFQKIELLRSVASHIYLVSNGRKHERNKALAESLGVIYIESKYRKPGLQVVSGVEKKKPLVVIGDKVLIDGMFAKRLGAQFLMVKRHTLPKEPLFDRLSCALDSLVSFFIV